MRVKSTVAALTVTAACATVGIVGVAVPAQASVSAASISAASTPFPCTFSGSTSGTITDFDATCQAPAGQQWRVAVKCRNDDPRFPLPFYAWGTIITGPGTSQVTCGARAGNMDNPFISLV